MFIFLMITLRLFCDSIQALLVSINFIEEVVYTICLTLIRHKAPIPIRAKERKQLLNGHSIFIDVEDLGVLVPVWALLDLREYVMQCLVRLCSKLSELLNLLQYALSVSLFTASDCADKGGALASKVRVPLKGLVCESRLISFNGGAFVFWRVGAHIL